MNKPQFICALLLFSVRTIQISRCTSKDILQVDDCTKFSSQLNLNQHVCSLHDFLVCKTCGRAYTWQKGRESHCDSVDIFAAAPQFANITNIIIVIVSIVIASIVTVTISIIMSSLLWQVAWENPWHPECLICMGKLMAWVNPWLVSWENPWHKKVKVLTVVGGTIEKFHE